MTEPAAGIAPPAPSAAIWRWRQDVDEERTRRAAAAAAARRQGLIGGAVGLLVATTIHLLLHRHGLAAIVAAVALLVALLAIASPLGLYHRLRQALDGLAMVVGTAMTWLLMTVLFYLLFLPAGLVLRAMGKLEFVRFADPARDSYWTATDTRDKPVNGYRKQF